jgi:hypothetical protein
MTQLGPIKNGQLKALLQFLYHILTYLVNVTHQTLMVIGHNTETPGVGKTKLELFVLMTLQMSTAPLTVCKVAVALTHEKLIVHTMT